MSIRFIIVMQVFLICSLISTKLFAFENHEIALEKLEYIKKFTDITPDLSRKEILKSDHLTQFLSSEERIEWLFQSALVANNLNDYPLYESSLKKISVINKKELSPEKTKLFLSLLGMFNLKFTYYQQALRAFYCASQKQKSDMDPIRNMYFISSVYLRAHKLDIAEEITQIVYEQVLEKNLESWKGSTVNSLGIFALHRKDYKTAIRYFKQSMDENQRNNNTTGEYNSGLNLLLSYALSSDILMYDRLIDRMKRLDVKINDLESKKYFELIEVLAKTLKNGPLTEKDKLSVQNKVDEMKSVLAINAVNDFIFPALGIEVKKVEIKEKEAPKWVLDILSNYECSTQEITPELLKKNFEKSSKEVYSQN